LITSHPSDLVGTVAVFFGHDVSNESRRAYRHLRSSCGPDVTVRWLLDTSQGCEIPVEYAAEVIPYNSQDFSTWGFPTMGDKLIPGHCHFPVMRMFMGNPGIEKLWVIEYDVRFTGRWATLFDHFATDDADLLTCHVRTQAQEPYWHWWSSLAAPVGEDTASLGRLRAFMVTARYSSAALQVVTSALRRGWRGHQEVVVPTLIVKEGLKLRDLNAPGSADGKRRIFYTSAVDEKGALQELGTLRYRPARQRAGLRRNTLYHPVKPGHMVRRRPLLTALRRKIAAARMALRLKFKHRV
jgi:hypothetical protein